MSYTLLCYKKRLNFYPNQRLSLPENILHLDVLLFPKQAEFSAAGFCESLDCP